MRSPVKISSLARWVPTRRGQEVAAAHRREDPAQDPELAERGGPRRDDDVAGERDVAAAADGDAVDARDHRLVELADAQDRLLRDAGVGDHAGRAEGREHGQVEVLVAAGAERAVAGAGDDDDADRVVVARPGERLLEVEVGLPVERVELGRPVHRQRRDRPVALDEQRLVGADELRRHREACSRPRSRIAARRRSISSGSKLRPCHPRAASASISQPSAATASAISRVGPPQAPHRVAVDAADVGGELGAERQQLGVRHDVVDEADAQRLLRVDEVAGEAHLARAAHADRLDEQDRAAPARLQADAGVGVAEQRALGGDEEVAVERDLQAAGDRRPVDRPDQRDLQRRDRPAAARGLGRRPPAAHDAAGRCRAP